MKIKVKCKCGEEVEIEVPEFRGDEIHHYYHPAYEPPAVVTDPPYGPPNWTCIIC